MGPLSTTTVEGGKLAWPSNALKSFLIRPTLGMPLNERILLSKRGSGRGLPQEFHPRFKMEADQ